MLIGEKNPADGNNVFTKTQFKKVLTMLRIFPRFLYRVRQL